MADFLVTILDGIVTVLPFLGPIFICLIAWQIWILYVRIEYITKIKWLLYEVRIPKAIERTPAAMEAFLNTLHQPSSGTWLDRFKDGRQPAWFSLEIASDAGRVRFFIRTSDRFKNLVESQLYAQYPEIELALVSNDYTEGINYTGQADSPWDLWGGELALAEADEIPIKTYIDYGLDKEGPPEATVRRVDPLAGLVEGMGAIGPDEAMWIQVLLTATVDKNKKEGSLFKKEGWKDAGKKTIAQSMEKKGGSEEFPGMVILSPGQRERLEAIERNLSKFGFDVGVRFMYLAKKEKFNKGNFAILASSWKYFNSSYLNGFKPTRTTDFDFPWQDPTGGRTLKKKREMFKAYRTRSYFYWPVVRKSFVLSAEELATVYHYPSVTFTTPTIERTYSRSTEAPSNLPT